MDTAEIRKRLAYAESQWEQHKHGPAATYWQGVVDGLELDLVAAQQPDRTRRANSAPS